MLEGVNRNIDKKEVVNRFSLVANTKKIQILVRKDRVRKKDEWSFWSVSTISGFLFFSLFEELEGSPQNSFAYSHS